MSHATPGVKNASNLTQKAKIMSTKTGTIRSYNQIAERFYENNKDRSKIEGNLDRFVHYCKPNVQIELQK